MKRVLPALLASSCLLGVAVPVSAQSVEEFYRGTTLRVMIGYPAGGGYDIYGRLVARHIGQYIPGNPNIIVENLPGAGSMTLINNLANTTPRDGSVIAGVDRALPSLPLLSDDPLQFDVRTLNWMGSVTNEVYVCVVWHESDIQEWSEVMDGSKNLIVGGTGPTAENENVPRMLTNLLGANIRIISGYPGTGDVGVAMEQGELDGQCGSWSSIRNRSDWLATDAIRVLVQFGTEPAPDLPDVPLIYEFIEDEQDEQVVRLVTSRLLTARPFVAPPEIPEDRLNALLSAFERALTDPALLAEAEQMGLELNPVFAEEMLGFLDELYATPPEVIERAKEVLAVN